MSTSGSRRWAWSALDSHSHLLAAPDQGRPAGLLVALCGHQMPCSAPTGAQPLDHRVCGACRAPAAVEAPAPQFPAAGAGGGGRAAGPRLSVPISAGTEAALLAVRDTDGVSMAEALRRLVGYGQAVYQASRAGREIVLRGGGRPVEHLQLPDGPAGYGGLGPLAGYAATGSWRERAGRHRG